MRRVRVVAAVLALAGACWCAVDGVQQWRLWREWRVADPSAADLYQTNGIADLVFVVIALLVAAILLRRPRRGASEDAAPDGARSEDPAPRSTRFP